MRRFRAPRLDCFIVEEEEDPTEVFARVDLHGAAPIVGGELVKRGGDGGNSEGREGEAKEQAGGERGEEQVGGSSCSCPSGGTATREGAAAWARRRWRHGASAPCRHCAPLEIFRKGPENSGRPGMDPEKSGSFRMTSFRQKRPDFI